MYKKNLMHQIFLLEMKNVVVNHAFLIIISLGLLIRVWVLVCYIIKATRDSYSISENFLLSVKHGLSPLYINTLETNTVPGGSSNRVAFLEFSHLLNVFSKLSAPYITHESSCLHCNIWPVKLICS